MGEESKISTGLSRLDEILQGGLIGVLKKRLSSFENTIREFKITSKGIKVGAPLTNMRGILTGFPEELN